MEKLVQEWLSQLSCDERCDNHSSADGKVGAGMVVTALIAGDEMKFLLGSREIASGDIDVYSEKSPLGAAVLGAEIGATVSYTAPNGREIKVEIKAAEFFA